MTPHGTQRAALPLVLLPGMMCDERLFEPQIAALGGERAVHVLPLTGADSVDRLAGEVLAQAPPRFALAGLSMGGIVAMAMVRQATDRVDRLALLDTNPLPDAPERIGVRNRQIACAEAGGLRDILRDEMKPHYLGDGPNREAILDLCMAMGVALGPSAFVRQSRALRDRPDQCSTLARYGRPALVLCGRDDVLCPPERHRLMADLLADADLVVVDGAGHLPTLEQPDVTNDALCRWLTRAPRTASAG
ncbi:MAG: alpha/beta fold hydrolase [Pseudomonadota bacterium]